MEDDLSILGVVPSDRKKLENMGITKIDQIAIMSETSLGMGRSKGNTLIQRARNIIANENIQGIDIVSQDLVEIKVKKTDRAVTKSVLNVLDVYSVGWESTSLEIDGKTLKLKRRNPSFNTVLSKAETLKDIVDQRLLEQKEKNGIFLPEEQLIDFAKNRGFNGFWKNVFAEIHGNDIMKKVIITSMFSTYAEPVHSLIIGEPGSSKTMAKEIIGERFTNLTTIGSNTTRSGLVCTMSSTTGL